MARVDAAGDLLSTVASQVDGDAVRPQAPQTGHVTLFYAPLRPRGDGPALAERIRTATAAQPAFDLTCGGFGEFASPTRPVAWLGITAGLDALLALRARLCACEEDCHRHDFVPHLTIAYGEDPAAYGAVRETLRTAAEQATITARIDAIWVAGFPADGHPARDLRYETRIPLAGA